MAEELKLDDLHYVRIGAIAKTLDEWKTLNKTIETKSTSNPKIGFVPKFNEYIFIKNANDNSLTYIIGDGNTPMFEKIGDNQYNLNSNFTQFSYNKGMVLTNHIADNAITTAKIADGTIQRAKIANRAVGTDQIENMSVTTAKLNTDSVVEAKIRDGNVTTNKIANKAITTVKIADNAVTTDKIADGAITASKIGFTAKDLGLNTPFDYVGSGMSFPNDAESNNGDVFTLTKKYESFYPGEYVYINGEWEYLGDESHEGRILTLENTVGIGETPEDNTLIKRVDGLEKAVGTSASEGGDSLTERVEILQSDKLEGFSSSYEVTESGWHRVLIAQRGTPGTVDLCLTTSSANICTVSFDFTGFVRYKNDDDAIPSILQKNATFYKGTKATNNVDVSDISKWGKITKVRIGYPQVPENNNYNVTYCCLDAYLDFPSGLTTTLSCQASVRTNQRGMDIIKSALNENSKEHGLIWATDSLGEKYPFAIDERPESAPNSSNWHESELDFYTIIVNYEQQEYKPTAILNNKSILSENIYLKEKITINDFKKGNLGNEPVHIRTNVTESGLKRYNFYRKYNMLTVNDPFTATGISMSEAGAIVIDDNHSNPSYITLMHGTDYGAKRMVLTSGTYYTNLRMYPVSGSGFGPTSVDTGIINIKETTVITNARFYTSSNKKLYIPFLYKLSDEFDSDKNNLSYTSADLSSQIKYECESKDDPITITVGGTKKIIIDNYNDFYSSKYLNDSYEVQNTLLVDFIDGTTTTKDTANDLFYVDLISNRMPEESCYLDVSAIIDRGDDNISVSFDGGVYYVNGIDPSVQDLIHIGDIIYFDYNNAMVYSLTDIVDDTVNSIGNRYLKCKTKTENDYDTFAIENCNFIEIESYKYINVADKIKTLEAAIESLQK